MKERKNKVLIIGIVCQAILIIWSLVKAILQLFNEEGPLLWWADFVPVAVLTLVLVLPVLLLVRNMKNKMGETLPILSAVASGIVFLSVMASLFTAAIPNQLILNELGLANVYISLVINFVLNGGLVFIIGCAFLMIGSMLSLPPKATSKVRKSRK